MFTLLVPAAMVALVVIATLAAIGAWREGTREGIRQEAEAQAEAALAGAVL